MSPSLMPLATTSVTTHPYPEPSFIQPIVDESGPSNTEVGPSGNTGLERPDVIVEVSTSDCEGYTSDFSFNFFHTFSSFIIRLLTLTSFHAFAAQKIWTDL